MRDPVKPTSLSVPNGPVRLMWRMYRNGLPMVDRYLERWRQRVETIPDLELRSQAIASITTKTFHCQGGAVYATLIPSQMSVLTELIVAFQTISDYLDNLCDRSTSQDERDFRLLHQSMLDAVNPNRPITENYYFYRHEQNDGGYLYELVQTCRRIINSLPNYQNVSEYVNRWVGLYADLQVYKHLKSSEREKALLDWWERYKDEFHELKWNEFAAATGSTLGVFLMFVFAASEEPVDHLQDQAALYFPWVCALHILLDYLIDQEEDRLGGDLNFCSYYASKEEIAQRIQWIANRVQARVSNDPLGRFHHMVVDGLMAVYFSDPKAHQQVLVRQIRAQLMQGTPLIRMFFWLNSIWVRRMHPQVRYGG